MLLALLEYERSICPTCGHPMAECRDPRTAGTWTVVSEICQPARVAQAVAESESGTRGLHLYTRRTGV